MLRHYVPEVQSVEQEAEEGRLALLDMATMNSVRSVRVWVGSARCHRHSRGGKGRGSARPKDHRPRRETNFDDVWNMTRREAAHRHGVGFQICDAARAVGWTGAGVARLWIERTRAVEHDCAV